MFGERAIGSPPLCCNTQYSTTVSNIEINYVVYCGKRDVGCRSTVNANLILDQACVKGLVLVLLFSGFYRIIMIKVM